MQTLYHLLQKNWDTPSDMPEIGSILLLTAAKLSGILASFGMKKQLTIYII